MPVDESAMAYWNAPPIQPSTSLSLVNCPIDTATSPLSLSVIPRTRPPACEYASSASRFWLTCAAVSLIVAVAPSPESVAPYVTMSAAAWPADTIVPSRLLSPSVAMSPAAPAIAAALSAISSVTPMPRSAITGSRPLAIAIVVVVPSDSAMVPSTVRLASVDAAATTAAPVSDTSIVTPPSCVSTGSSPAATFACTVTGSPSLRLICRSVPSAARFPAWVATFTALSLTVTLPTCTPSCSSAVRFVSTASAVSDTRIAGPVSFAANPARPAASPASTGVAPSFRLIDCSALPSPPSAAVTASTPATLSVTCAARPSARIATDAPATCAALSATVSV